MRRFFSTIVLTLSAFICTNAQKYSIELQPDKKVIYVDALGLAENTPVMEVLRMMPELVVREGDDFLSGYNIFLDSKSMAYNSNVILATMKLYEIEKIEISTSSTASQQRNGMAGSIKIVSRQMPDGVSGSVTVNANTLWEVYPNINLNLRTAKLEMRGNVGLAHHSVKTSNYFEQYVPSMTEIGEDTIRERASQETARLYLKYKPTEKDQLKFWVLESYGYGRSQSVINSINILKMPDIGDDIYRITETADTSQLRGSKLNFSVFADYEHTFRDAMKFELSADYIRDCNKDGTTTLDGVTPDKSQAIRSDAKFVLPFMPAGNRILNLSVGGNVEYDLNDRLKVESRSFFASPYLELKYESAKWKVNSGVRYQYYNLEYEKSEQKPFENGSDEITFNVNSLWQMADHHALKFFVTRNLIHPSSDQLYPSTEWNSNLGTYIAGNRNLLPAEMHSFDLEYITDWSAGSHKFITNVRLAYDRTDRMVSMVRRYDKMSNSFYMTYANSGKSDIVKAMANVLYRYGIFSVSLAGNWFHNIMKDEKGTDNIDNFNICLSPVFCFRRDWTLSGTFIYNNAVISNDSRLGECLYSNLRLNRSFGKWIVSAVLSDIFGYVSENYEYKNNGYYYTMYDQYPRCVEFGVVYRIGSGRHISGALR